MSAIEKGFIPLRRMEEEQPSDKLIVNLNLPPYVDQDRICVDLARIHKLCGIAGINRILLIGELAQEIRNSVPHVVGINPDGSAMASRSAAISKAQMFDSKRSNRSEDGRTDTRVVDISIKANINEISLRAANTRNGVQSPNEWAKALDKGIRTPVRVAGTLNLITTRPHLKPDGPVLLVAPYLASNIVNFPDDIFGVTLYGMEIATYGISRLVDKQDNVTPNHRFSLIPGPQIDRAIWFNLVLATGKLVRDMYPDKNLGKPSSTLVSY